MTPAQLLASARSLIESDPDGHGLIDRCDLIDSTFVDGGAGGDTTEPDTLASDQPCLHEELSGPSAQMVVGGEAITATHRIFMLWSASAQALTENGKITVTARDPFPEMIFEKPSLTRNSLLPLAEFKAVLVKRGYQ